MSVLTLLNTDFESEVVDTFPTGAGDTSGGSWSQYPTGEGSILIKNDPGATYGKSLQVDSNGVVTGSRMYAIYTFDQLVIEGDYTISFKMMRPNVGPGEDAGVIVSSRYRTYEQILFKIQNGGNLQFAGYTGPLSLYSFANYPGTVSSTTDNTWIDVEITANNSTGTCTIKVDGVSQGWDDSSTWNSDFPLGLVSGPTLYTYVDRIQFYATDTVSRQIAYFDEVSVAWDSTNDQEDPPDKITIISPFTLDDSSVTSYIDNTTPNRASSSLDGNNTINPAVGRKWYSDDPDAGYHKLLFDMGSGNTDILRFFAIFNHNLDDVTSPDTGSISSIKFKGGNTVLNGSVLSPEVSANLTNQRLLDPMVVWLPTHTACRYYELEILITLGTLSSIDNIQIGRVVGATIDEIWTPDDEFYYQYQWEDIYPAELSLMESYGKQARYHSSYKQLSISWPWLGNPDQEDLRDIFASSGTHKQYVLMLDPSDEPQDYTILGYMNGNSLNMDRYFKEGAKVSMSFRETVE